MTRPFAVPKTFATSVAGLLLLSAAFSGPASARQRHHHTHRSLAGTPKMPALRSSSALVVDENTSTVLLSKQADAVIPIASITKLMTSLVVLEAKQSPDDMIQLTREDREIGRGGHSRLPTGATLSRGDLMHLALMSSENRAALTLGNRYPGGLPACVAAMNAKAKALGMTHTHFADPTGLSSLNTSSPGDLSKLVIAAAENPVIRNYSTDQRHTVQIGRHRLEFRNTDNLVANPSWNIVVQKTGYTVDAGRCLVMKAIIEDRPIVIVLLDSYGKYTRIADAKRIRDWIHDRANERVEHASTR